MLITNARIFRDEGFFEPGEIEIDGGRFGKIKYGAAACANAGVNVDANVGVNAGANDHIVDAGGRYAIPGLIDIHLHGCAGYNFYDADPDSLMKMLRYQAANGVTAVCPATLTLPEEALARACESAAAFIGREKGADFAALLGVHLEGPFLSPKKAGAQNPAYAIPPDMEMFKRLAGISDGLVKIVAVSPELEGALDFIAAASKETVVAIAHTNAGYEAVAEAFKRGASHAVHLYNAMSPLTHREPGAVGAIFDTPGITAEIICDGVHLHPAAVRIALKALGPARPVFVSDSMAATGLGDGFYDLGGLPIKVEGKAARLVNGGNIASSVSNLMDCVRAAVKSVGVPLADAVRCASANPARVMGAGGERGRIAEGLIADLALLDDDLNVCKVFVRGRELI